MENVRCVKASLSESDFSQRIKHQFRQKIAGIERVYVPYYDLHALATFSNGCSPFKGRFHVDAILLSIHSLDADYSEPQLMNKSSGTLFPVAFSEAQARNALKDHVVSLLPGNSGQEDGLFNLSIECSGKYYFPFWVAYFQGARPDLFERMVFDPLSTKANEKGKEIVNKGFLLLDEAKADLPPWF